MAEKKETDRFGQKIFRGPFGKSGLKSQIKIDRIFDEEIPEWINKWLEENDPAGECDFRVKITKIIDPTTCREVRIQLLAKKQSGSGLKKEKK